MYGGAFKGIILNLNVLFIEELKKLSLVALSKLE